MVGPTVSIHVTAPGKRTECKECKECKKFVARSQDQRSAGNRTRECRGWELDVTALVPFRRACIIFFHYWFFIFFSHYYPCPLFSVGPVFSFLNYFYLFFIYYPCPLPPGPRYADIL